MFLYRSDAKFLPVQRVEKTTSVSETMRPGNDGDSISDAPSLPVDPKRLHISFSSA